MQDVTGCSHRRKPSRLHLKLICIYYMCIIVSIIIDAVVGQQLRPVRVAGFVRQVQDVTRHVVLCGEIGQHPGLLGGRHLQPTDGAVPVLPAPADTEKQ